MERHVMKAARRLWPSIVLTAVSVSFAIRWCTYLLGLEPDLIVLGDDLLMFRLLPGLFIALLGVVLAELNRDPGTHRESRVMSRINVICVLSYLAGCMPSLW